MALRHRHRSRLLGDSLSTSGQVATGDGARYDEAYFDKWYRNPRTRVKGAAELRRQVAFVLHTAEWTLGRPVRTVLDVGCGMGNWQPVLTKLRPGLSYDGVDPSAYAVSKFGKRRGLQQGSIEDLPRLPLRPQYDLVVCCGMLNYLSTEQLRKGLAGVQARTGGVAYLELFADGDAFEGDTGWPAPQSLRWYRREITRAGFLSIGMQCYVPRRSEHHVSLLERGW